MRVHDEKTRQVAGVQRDGTIDSSPSADARSADDVTNIVPVHTTDDGDEATNVVTAPAYLTSSDDDHPTWEAPSSGGFRVTAGQAALLVATGVAAFVGVGAMLPASPLAQQTSHQQARPRSSRPVVSKPANFPPDATTSCLGNGETPVSVRVREGSPVSCGFASEARDKVLAAIATSGNTSTFTISPISEVKHTRVSLTCTRHDYLTYCEGGSNAALWVRDAPQA